jgi:hypothetical protein
LEVVCGFEVDCEGIGEEIKVIIKGKSIRAYLGGSSGSEGTSGGDQSSLPTGGGGSEEGGDGQE